jgi:hypothetical protein
MRFLSILGLLTGISPTCASHPSSAIDDSPREEFTPPEFLKLARQDLTTPGLKLSKSDVIARLVMIIRGYNQLVASGEEALSKVDDPYLVALYTDMCDLSIANNYGSDNPCQRINLEDDIIMQQLVVLMNKAHGHAQGEVYPLDRVRQQSLSQSWKRFAEYGIPPEDNLLIHEDLFNEFESKANEPVTESNIEFIQPAQDGPPVQKRIENDMKGPPSYRPQNGHLKINRHNQREEIVQAHESATGSSGADRPQGGAVTSRKKSAQVRKAKKGDTTVANERSSRFQKQKEYSKNLRQEIKDRNPNRRGGGSFNVNFGNAVRIPVESEVKAWKSSLPAPSVSANDARRRLENPDERADVPVSKEEETDNELFSIKQNRSKIRQNINEGLAQLYALDKEDIPDDRGFKIALKPVQNDRSLGATGSDK